MFLRGVRFFLLLVLACTTLSAMAADLYVVKAGDVLSTIARKHFHGALYTPKTGAIARLVALNPQIHNPNQLQIGQKLALRASDMPAAQAEVRDKPEFAEALVGRESLTRIPAQENPEQRTLPAQAHSFLSFTTNTASSKLLMTDLQNNNAQATYYSQHNFGIALEWEQQWTEKWGTSLGMGLRNIVFQAPTASSFEHETVNLQNFSLGVSYLPIPHLYLRLQLSDQQNLLVRAKSSTLFTFDQISNLGLGILARYDFAQVGNFVFAAQAQIAQFIPFGNLGYVVKSGSEVGSALILEHNFEHWRVGGQIFANYGVQQSAYERQRQIDVGIKIGVSYLFGEVVREEEKPREE